MFFLFMSGHQNECTHHSYLWGELLGDHTRVLEGVCPQTAREKKLIARFVSERRAEVC